MNKKLVAKICTSLLENNVKAQDVYFHWNEIHKELASIEESIKGIVDSIIGRWGSKEQRKTELYNGQVVRDGDKVSFIDSDGCMCVGIIKRRDDKTLYFLNSRFDITDYQNAKKV